MSAAALEMLIRIARETDCKTRSKDCKNTSISDDVDFKRFRGMHLILALDNFVVCLSITSSSLSQSVVYYEKIIAYSY